jgi:hypothetical protein
MDDPRLNAAREWAELGARVVVCSGKNPGALLGEDWPSKATTDIACIQAWLEKWPTANLGVLPGDAVLLLDVDDPARLTELEAELGPIPPTPRYLTGGAPGRERIVFRHPGTQVRKTAFGDGIEVRTGSLMSVVPPGHHPVSGEPIEWRTAFDEEPLHPLAPGWLARATRNGDQPDVPLEVPGEIAYGVQHNTLVSLAGSMRKRGHTEAEILAMLLETNRRCQRPGTREDMEGIARSVCRNYDPELDAVILTTVVGEEAAPPNFKIVRLHEHRIRSPRWAFEERILVGALNGLVGAGGVGKGTFVSWMIAGWTRGELPGDFDSPVNVLIVGDEDDLDEVWTPRVMAANGDVSRVLGLEYTEGRTLDLVRDVKALERFVLEHDIGVIYLDQVLDHIAGDLNANLPRDVRLALAPVRSLARRLERTVLYTAHPTKASGALSLRDRTGGSHQFMDLPRSGLFLGYHPEDRGRRALSRGKGNVGQTPPALVFDIEPTFVVNSETKETVDVGVVANLETEEGLTAEAINVDPPRERKQTKAGRCEELLRGLGSSGEWTSRKHAEAVCRSQGIGKDTFREVFGHLDKEVRPNPNDHRETDWRLADATAED